jgi:hypothetical protein
MYDSKGQRINAVRIVYYNLDDRSQAFGKGFIKLFGKKKHRVTQYYHPTPIEIPDELIHILLNVADA